jgi:hypothetical protein
MEICVLSKIVILLSIIIISFDVCVFGLSAFSFLTDILFTVFLVMITNWYCEYWIAKGIVIFVLVSALILIVMCLTKHKIHYQIIEDEKLRRTK